MMTDTIKVLLLKGGVSAEREVSLATAAACSAALDTLGYAYQELDFQGDVSKLIAALQECTVMLNCLHGTYGEDGRIQAIADFMRVPYSHSGVCASALAMHKVRALDIFRAHDLPIAKSVAFKKAEVQELCTWPLPLPLVVKPAAEGSSVGVHVFGGNQDFAQHHSLFCTLAQTGDLLFEEYISGRELTVAVAEDTHELVALGVTELVVEHGFYDYQAKYSTKGGAQHFCPAPITEGLADLLKSYALKAHRVLGLRGVSRTDFRYDPEADRVVLLETNTQPGMTETSLLPEQAAYHGWTFPCLIKKILQAACHD